MDIGYIRGYIDRGKFVVNFDSLFIGQFVKRRGCGKALLYQRT